MAIWAMTQSGAVPLGSYLAGVAADVWNEPRVLQLLGLIYLVSASGLWLLYRYGARSQPNSRPA
jgi:hypothetical protein